MRILVFLIVIVFFSFGCNSDQKANIKTISKDSVLIVKDTIGKPFFNFDEVVHYNIGISDEEFDKLFDSKKHSQKI